MSTRRPERGPMKIPDSVGAAQRRAANPAVSAFVSANAGSGKTKVLTDRVIRLMLAGTPPARILCLTFTKAAAANMAIRVFQRLSDWVALDDAALQAKLEDLEERRPDAARLAEARRLFARAVETPGGLKIETIHAFCERLLHIAPFEANVPASFTVLDDLAAQELREEALKGVLARAVTGDEAIADAFATVDAYVAGERLDAVLREALAEGDVLATEQSRAASLSAIADVMGLAPEDTPAAFEARMLAGAFPVAERADLAAAFLATGSSNDGKQAACLQQMAEARDDAARLAAYRGLFFRKDGGPKADSTLATKAMGVAIKERLVAERARLEELEERRRAAAALARTRALYTLAGAVHARIVAEKRRLGALDFDDLIRTTLALLRRGEAAWLLYKLDRGIDHILVDEAQDTNPAQWEILRALTEELHACAGAAGGRPRTVFAVGDPKQSIYSFQGAEPQRFQESLVYYEKVLKAAELPFEDVSLIASFRSAPTVLRAVDRVFGIPEHFDGLAFDDAAVGTVHETVWPEAPGLVEVWPLERPTPRPEPDAWTHPVDTVSDAAPAIVAARRVARAIETWTTSGDACGRVCRPGDVLVLVRKRNAAFHAVIKALKDRGIPVAGADRLSLTRHIAVEDLIAVGRAVLLPDDDLTLATALKTPLVGLDDDDLLRIAVARDEKTSLAAALGAAADAGDPAASRGRDAFRGWRRLAETTGPFGFYAALLGPGGGRRALVARLGSEAGDAIDAFLSLAREAEAPEAPSLARFLVGFERVEREIKRDMDNVANEVRVMTVHGSKGLEAPVVVLLDDAGGKPGRQPSLLPVTRPGGGTVPVWAPSKAEDCDVLSEARTHEELRAARETNRLLYVALTRAEGHLVVAPYFGRPDGEAPATAWSAMVARALDGMPGPSTIELPYGEALVWRENVVLHPVRSMQPAEPATPDPFPDPAWLHRPAPVEAALPPPLSPSTALAAADRPARQTARPFVASARLRGTLVHALVERLPGLPEAARRKAAEAFVAARAAGLPEDARAAIVADACAVVADERLAPLFGPDALAEAPVAGTVLLPDGASVGVAGRIDRLAIGADEIRFADFKTGARPPPADAQIPEETLAQAALYAALLARAFPGRRIVAQIVWTAGPLVRTVDDDALAHGLAIAARRRRAAAGGAERTPPTDDTGSAAPAGFATRETAHANAKERPGSSA